MATRFSFKNLSPIAKEIITISLGFENPQDEFGREKWFKELAKNIETWVTSNNVSNMEFILSEDQLYEYGFEPSEFETLTKNKITFLEEDEFYNLKESIPMGEGPGWDGVARDDTSWNNEYLYTGSDGSYYILVKKI